MGYSIIFNYYYASTTKPGNPSDTMAEEHANEYGNMRICKKCNFYKPRRSHHCSVCKQCVMRMDHHCPW